MDERPNVEKEEDKGKVFASLFRDDRELASDIDNGSDVERRKYNAAHLLCKIDFKKGFH